jgi:hypothetical protein
MCDIDVMYDMFGCVWSHTYAHTAVMVHVCAQTYIHADICAMIDVMYAMFGCVWSHTYTHTAVMVHVCAQTYIHADICAMIDVMYAMFGCVGHMHIHIQQCRYMYKHRHACMHTGVVTHANVPFM